MEREPSAWITLVAVVVLMAAVALPVWILWKLARWLRRPPRPRRIVSRLPALEYMVRTTCFGDAVPGFVLGNASLLDGVRAGASHPVCIPGLAKTAKPAILSA